MCFYAVECNFSLSVAFSGSQGIAVTCVSFLQGIPLSPALLVNFPQKYTEKGCHKCESEGICPQ